MTENMRAYAQAKKGVNMTEHMRAYLAKGKHSLGRRTGRPRSHTAQGSAVSGSGAQAQA
jgi:hypothetical protein